MSMDLNIAWACNNTFLYSAWTDSVRDCFFYVLQKYIITNVKKIIVKKCIKELLQAEEGKQ